MAYSRRQFIRTTGTGLAALPFLGLPVRAMAHPELTIQQALDHITSQLGFEVPEHTVDTVKSGDPSAALTGIGTTFMATIPVIRQAIDQNVNLLITHEPTYYNHHDETAWLEEDQVYQFKRNLLEEHGIVVWRFHDLWHRYRPDGIMTGFYRQLGWTDSLIEGEDNVVAIPPAPLNDLTKFLKQKLSLNRVFMIGDPKLVCSRIGCLPGAWGKDAQISLLQKEIDVLLVGEVSEWETAEYVRDAAAAGLNKGLIILGHADSEEPGMVYCREWMEKLFPDFNCIHFVAGDSFQHIV